ncbi:tetratricopeptide repeat protein [Novosphingobium sp.]|uniref:tetratricopeptide repeat protein n=1 Tax=Novosphingobium sp. TaxID=1874826 RepID=UPI00334009E6
MTEADPVPDVDARSGAPVPPALTLGGVLRRLAVGLAVVGAIGVSGVAIYRNQRQSAGLPMVAAPAPRETQSATVEDEITRLQRQVAETPDDADAWRTLGWSYFQRDQFTQSADALRQATFIDPTNARTFSFLGEALLQARKGQRRMPHEARAAFDTAIRLDPKDARARYYRAVGWDLAGQHRRAINGWLALLADTPPDAPYTADIRAVIKTVGARHHIKVDKRLADVRYIPPESVPAKAVPIAPATKPGARPARRPGGATLPGLIGAPMRAVEDVPQPAPSDASER